MTRIAAIQTSSSDDVRDNLSRIDPLLEQARDAGASVVVLPECFAFMQSSRAQLRETAEADGTGPIQDWCRERAVAHDLWLIAGSLPARSQDPKRVYNSLRVYAPDGAEAARYDKIFLFDVDLESGESFRESDYTVPGDNVLAVSTPAGVIGLSVCYDLRFPELYRRLAAAGAEVLVVPSAFARSTGDAHWMTLLRARAIENQCYVVAPAQFGRHNPRRSTWGHSVIIDPWGKVLETLVDGWGIISAEVDRGRLDAVRRQLPCLLHRRPDIFGD